ncbi:MAG: aldo/keto reductase [Spirochaetaceae bacterium]|nr:MAG: aldo/keto reductase [Spirochaetaceae bacterium]
MNFKVLGKTGINVSRIGFGAASLGDSRKESSRADSLRAVRAALDGGINLIDVSPYYGATEAERVVGQGISDWPRDQVIIATKAGRYGNDEFDFSPRRLVKSLDESLTRLNTDYIDIFQLHDVEYADLDYIVNESIPAIIRLKESGKIRFVGVTAYPIRTLRTILERAEVDTILSHCRYSINDTSIETLRPLIERTNAGLIHTSPFSMGLLTQRGPFQWHPAPNALKEACRAAADFCVRQGSDIAKLALQFSLQAEWIPTTVLGSSSPETVERNLRLAEEPLDQELLAGVRAILQPVLNLAWTSGRPENNDPQPTSGTRSGPKELNRWTARS